MIYRLGRGALAATLLSFVAVAWYGQHELQYGSPREASAWILLSGLAGVLIAMAVGARVTGDPSPSAPRASFNPQLTPAIEWGAVAALFLVGVVYRVIHFSSIPDGMNHDSAWYGMYAIHITHGAEYTPYISAAWGRETLFMYIVAPFVRWLGNTPEAIQVASAMCGVVALVPMYILGHLIFGSRIAFIAMAFLVVSGWHGVFTRAGWRVITVPPFEILALYGAWRAVHEQRRRYWILMGAGAALSIYTYNAARIVPLISAACYLWFFPRDRERWRRYLIGGVLAFVTFILVGLPMLWYAATHFQQFQGRADFLFQERGERGSTLTNWWNALRLFNYRGNGDDFFVQEPLLEPLAGVLFLIGAALALRHARRGQYAFVLLGFFISLLPGVLSVPNGNRCITALPFVYLLIAIGLDGVVTTITALSPRRWAPALAVGLIALGSAVAAFESYDEFLGPNRRPIHGYSAGATAAGMFMRQHMDRYKTYIISPNWPEYTLIYLSYDGRGDPFERRFGYGRTLGEVEGDIDRHGSRGLMFLLDYSPDAMDAFEQLSKRFTDHRVEVLQPPRIGTKPVGRAFFVEPAGLSAAGLWSNYSRSLFLHRPATTAPQSRATRCGPTLGDATGVSTRLRIMLPELGTPASVARIDFWRHCPPETSARPLLTVAVNPQGLVAMTMQEATLLPWAKLEAGRWYDVYVALQARDHTARVTLEGIPVAATASLPLDPQLPLHVSGVDVVAEHPQDSGGEFYLDDLTVLGGVVEPRSDAWMAAKRPEDVPALQETFDATPFGALAAGAGWTNIAGAVAVVDSPRVGRQQTAAAAGTNAFDGGNSERSGEFNEPMGVAVDPSGNFYVSERLGNRIQKFGSDGTYLAQWGKAGGAPGEFREPMDLAGDANFLYVADTWNHRIQVFDWKGTFAFEIKSDPSLSSPRGIDARHGKVYLADSGRGIVRVFDQSGKQLLTMGQSGGSEPGHLVEPVDVAVDSAGRIYVVNPGNNRIEIFAADGQPAGSIPVSGWQGPGLKEGYLMVGADDVIYLSDPISQHVRRFKPDGTELPPLPARIDSPSGLQFDGDRLLVSARRVHRIRVIDRDQMESTTAAAK